jgi:hypothetical protein
LSSPRGFYPGDQSKPVLEGQIAQKLATIKNTICLPPRQSTASSECGCHTWLFERRETTEQILSQSTTRSRHHAISSPRFTANASQISAKCKPLAAYPLKYSPLVPRLPAGTALLQRRLWGQSTHPGTCLFFIYREWVSYERSPKMWRTRAFAVVAVTAGILEAWSSFQGYSVAEMTTTAMSCSVTTKRMLNLERSWSSSWPCFPQRRVGRTLR